MPELTGKVARKYIKKAGEGDRVLTGRVSLAVKFRNPRLYDDYTDFDDVKGESGVYVIYCCDKKRTTKTRASRILYIGRGWVGGRLLYHKLNKRGLEKFAREHTVKFAFCPIGDVDWEFIIEGILLLEHEYHFDELPYFNRNGGSKDLWGWHDVLSLQPGPKRTLMKYGG